MAYFGIRFHLGDAAVRMVSCFPPMVFPEVCADTVPTPLHSNPSPAEIANELVARFDHKHRDDL